jgi:ribosomal protein S18 acetylase RimI-like enzyme
MAVTIERFQEDRWQALLPILRATFAKGDTYAFDPTSSDEEIRRAWIDAPKATFVAIDERNEIVGTYFIKPNQPGLGSHVCNCGYVVSSSAQGRGIATMMCEHSQVQARAMGFRAMQFNLVVSTNERAVALWKRLGFEIVGTIPDAFHHQTLGYVDAYVMYKTLIGS